MVVKMQLTTFQIVIFRKWLLMMMRDPKSQKAKVKGLKMTSQVINQILHDNELLQEETLPLHLASQQRSEVVLTESIGE